MGGPNPQDYKNRKQLEKWFIEDEKSDEKWDAELDKFYDDEYFDEVNEEQATDLFKLMAQLDMKKAELEKQQKIRMLKQVRGLPGDVRTFGMDEYGNPIKNAPPPPSKRKYKMTKPGQRQIQFPDPPKRDPNKPRTVELAEPKVTSPQKQEQCEETSDKVLPEAFLKFRAPKIFNGTYRVKNSKTGEHRTFLVKTQPPESNFAPGKRVVAVVDGNYDPFAFLSKNTITVWRRKKSNSDKKTEYEYYALMITGLILQGTESKWYERGYRISLDEKNCVKCNRKLTSEDSQKRGIGPICAVKVAEKPERVKKFLQYIGKDK